MISKALVATLLVAMVPTLPQNRIEKVSSDMYEATITTESPFKGEAAELAAVAALAAIGEHEGLKYSLDVEECRITSDNDKTISMYGLMQGSSWQTYKRKQICSDGMLAAKLSLDALRLRSTNCKRSTVQGWFMGYASGDCSKPSDAGRRLCQRWERLTTLLGLSNATCSSKGKNIGYIVAPWNDDEVISAVSFVIREKEKETKRE